LRLQQGFPADEMGLRVNLRRKIRQSPMSHMGQKQTLKRLRPTSALPPKADIVQPDANVRFVPKADILRYGKKRRYSITSSARASIDYGIVRPS
jgi:hypothetical protein